MGQSFFMVGVTKRSGGYEAMRQVKNEGSSSLGDMLWSPSEVAAVVKRPVDCVVVIPHDLQTISHAG